MILRAFLAILACICLQARQSIAFQQPSLVASSSRVPTHVSASARPSPDCNGDDDGQSIDNISRRDALSRTIYGIGLSLATSTMNSQRGNALDLSSFMLSAEGENKGVYAPSKKLGGLTNKIRAVSKIMVSKKSGFHWCVRQLFTGSVELIIDSCVSFWIKNIRMNSREI